MNNTYLNKIDCKHIAQEIKNKVKQGVRDLGDSPQLATVFVGERPDSAIYVANKKKVLEEVDMMSVTSYLQDTVSTDELLKLIDFYNYAEDINGILVQFPLPSHISERTILEAIHPLKDVDGLTNVNLGKLMAKEDDGLAPCTPLGVLEIIKRAMPDYKGKKVMVIGRSVLLGKSLTVLLNNEDMVVMNTHSKSNDDIKSHIDNFKPDILVSCAGVKNLIDVDMVKDSSIKVLIDCAIVREKGKKEIRGDFNKEQYDELDKTGIKWTSVPGGVGVLTTAMLSKNLLTAYELQEYAWYSK